MRNLVFLFFVALPMLCFGVRIIVHKAIIDKRKTLLMPVHMNLWLFEAPSPSNNAEVEIIIHSFNFTPK